MLSDRNVGSPAGFADVVEAELRRIFDEVLRKEEIANLVHMRFVLAHPHETDPKRNAQSFCFPKVLQPLSETSGGFRTRVVDFFGMPEDTRREGNAHPGKPFEIVFPKKRGIGEHLQFFESKGTRVFQDFPKALVDQRFPSDDLAFPEFRAFQLVENPSGRFDGHASASDRSAFGIAMNAFFIARPRNFHPGDIEDVEFRLRFGGIRKEHSTENPPFDTIPVDFRSFAKQVFELFANLRGTLRDLHQVVGGTGVDDAYGLTEKVVESPLVDAFDEEQSVADIFRPLHVRLRIRWKRKTEGRAPPSVSPLISGNKRPACSTGPAWAHRP